MSSARTSHPTAASSAATDDPRERILSAAGQEFAEKGYEAATIRDICTAAGVNVAAVNYYFGDKRRLYNESVTHAHQQRVRQVPLPKWPPGTPPEQKLRDFVGNMLQRMLGFDQPPWQVRLMLREILTPRMHAGSWWRTTSGRTSLFSCRFLMNLPLAACPKRNSVELASALLGSVFSTGLPVMW